MPMEQVKIPQSSPVAMATMHGRRTAARHQSPGYWNITSVKTILSTVMSLLR